MKIRTNKKILLTSGIGLGLILVGLLAFQFQTYSRALFYVGLCLIIVGFNTSCVALYAATTSKPKTELVADERSRESMKKQAILHLSWFCHLYQL